MLKDFLNPCYSAFTFTIFSLGLKNILEPQLGQTNLVSRILLDITLLQ